MSALEPELVKLPKLVEPVLPVPKPVPELLKLPELVPEIIEPVPEPVSEPVKSVKSVTKSGVSILLSSYIPALLHP